MRTLPANQPIKFEVRKSKPLAAHVEFGFSSNTCQPINPTDHRSACSAPLLTCRTTAHNSYFSPNRCLFLRER